MPYFNEDKVRVAIIDTGIELPAGCESIYPGQIMECRSWLTTNDPDGTLEGGDRDLDGHGTHSTGLILKLAPNATVYVARVFESRTESQGKGHSEVTEARIANVSECGLTSFYLNNS